MKFFAILSSMLFESDMLIAAIKNIHTYTIAGKTVYRGQLSRYNILLAGSGLGKVNAAHSATCLVENFPVKAIVNIGVGGAYPGSRLKTGDVAIATKEIYGDEGVITSRGWEGLRKIGIPLVRHGRKQYYNEFILNSSLVRKTVRLITRHLSPVTKFESGPFVTVSSTTGARKRAVELENRYNAICENMEGAAIAQVCTIYRIPMLEIRGISNIVGERDKRKWDLDTASDNCQNVVLKLLNSGTGLL